MNPQAWDTSAAAAMQASCNRTQFDELVAHIESARAIAASLSGVLTEADTVHERLDGLLEFARRECWPVDAPTRHDHDEEYFMEQARDY